MTKCSHLLLIVFLIFSLLFPYTNTYATSNHNSFNTSITEEEVALLDVVKNIKSEMALAAQSAYANKLNGKSTDSQAKILETVATQINLLTNALQPYQNQENLSLKESNILLTFFNVINFLKFMQQDLTKYLAATDDYIGYELLVAYIKADSLLSQILIDYQYIQ